MTKYDLGQLADELGSAHPQIEALYLFGSRRFQTKSVRSDVDVLVATTGYVKPADLREFSESHCPALDLFILKDGRATSCQNESFIEDTSAGELIKKLDAVRFWQRNGGRLEAKIAWTFELRDDVKYIATALPNGAFPPKRKAPDEMTIGELISSLKPAHLKGIAATIVALIVGTFALGAWLGKTIDGNSNESQGREKASEPAVSTPAKSQ